LARGVASSCAPIQLELILGLPSRVNDALRSVPG